MTKARRTVTGYALEADAMRYDGERLTIHLHQGITFHDPEDAKEVRRTLMRRHGWSTIYGRLRVREVHLPTP